MDGVLFDFAKAALKLHCPNGWRHILETYPKGLWEMAELMDITVKEFWDKINEVGWRFWAGLEAYPWAMPLYNGLKELGDVVLLSSPSRDPNCLKGKVMCLQNFFMEGADFRDFIFAPSSLKRYLAAPDRILVDDNDDNVRNFREAGGHAVLVPQPWNQGVEFAAAEDMLNYIKGGVIHAITDIAKQGLR
jgi:hypothetical protein